MAAGLTVVLVVSLMTLVTTQGCSAEGEGKGGLELVSGLKGLAHSLQCFGKVLGESSLLQKKNLQVLQESLVFQRENSETRNAVDRLADLVVQLKEQLSQQSKDIRSMKEELSASHKTEKFTGEDDLKTQLANEVKKVEVLAEQLKQSAKQVAELSDERTSLNSTVAQLQDNLLAARKENYQHILKVQQLEHRLRAAENESQLNTHEVQELNKKLNESRKHVELLEEKIDLLNKTVENQDKEEEDKCSLAEGDTIRDVMQEYNRTKEWEVARRGLNGVLDQSSVAFRQLQKILFTERNPLHEIGARGYSELIKELVLCGQAVKMADTVGLSMLHGAARSGHEELVGWLLGHGADVESTDSAGWTPVMYAVYYDRLEMVKYLLQAGASTATRNNKGDTALEFARNYGRNDVVDYLVHICQISPT